MCTCAAWSGVSRCCCSFYAVSTTPPRPVPAGRVRRRPLSMVIVVCGTTCNQPAQPARPVGPRTGDAPLDWSSRLGPFHPCSKTHTTRLLARLDLPSRSIYRSACFLGPGPGRSGRDGWPPGTGRRSPPNPRRGCHRSLARPHPNRSVIHGSVLGLVKSTTQCHAPPAVYSGTQ